MGLGNNVCGDTKHNVTCRRFSLVKAKARRTCCNDMWEKKTQMKTVFGGKKRRREKKTRDLYMQQNMALCGFILMYLLS